MKSAEILSSGLDTVARLAQGQPPESSPLETIETLCFLGPIFLFSYLFLFADQFKKFGEKLEKSLRDNYRYDALTGKFTKDNSPRPPESPPKP